MSIFVLYFKNVMRFDLSQSANTFTNYMGSAFLLTVVGGFISDTYLSRLTTCLSFGLLQILALTMITIQAFSKKLHPEASCGKSTCLRGGEALMFYSSLCLLALGGGGVRGSLAPLGADQFDPKDKKGAKGLATYFNWLLLSITTGAIVGVTAVVWVSMNKDWSWGFLIGTITSSLGFIALAMGKPFYITRPRGTSPVTRVAQVSLSLSMSLDKAAILPDGKNPDPWTVCTVTQIEEVKILTRMFPILASTIIMNTCLSQLQTFSVMQGYYMDPQLGSLKVPTASIPVIPLVFMSILIPVYEFLVVPFARKITGHPAGITQLQRVGVGLVLSAISMGIAGIIEVKRRDQFFKNPRKPISLFWLSFQYGIFGIADMFTMVGLLEFFYKEAPSGMKSLSTSFTSLSLSFGFFLSTVFVDIVNSITQSATPSKKGWLKGQTLNDSKLNLFYWFLGILSCINFANYLFWASWYKYKDNNTTESQMETKALNVSSCTSKIEDTKEESKVREELQENKESQMETKVLSGSSCTSKVEDTKEESKVCEELEENTESQMETKVLNGSLCTSNVEDTK
ncbi:Protein NRT1/ PTR FAMILY 4.6 [Camellia lanceoleosa]|uniref:Protein NRT1/ PTR FAMILY 4.6 n=1 Tax=Camellia lanceoleosa TaxID=1840588 RepID=A0ACC0F088_9ERIC|nr:Protein NRT1/ PTR FAMILY 4.6 [Camellia lanceoleosa]